MLGLPLVAAISLVVVLQSSAGSVRLGQKSSFDTIIHPLEIEVVGVHISPDESGGTLTAKLAAHNDVDLAPGYANAKIKLTSLQLIIDFQSVTEDGQVQVRTVQVNPSPSVNLSPGQRLEFEILVGEVPGDAASVVTVTVSGSYAGEMTDVRPGPDGEITTVINVQGSISPFDATLSEGRTV